MQQKPAKHRVVARRPPVARAEWRDAIPAAPFLWPLWTAATANRLAASYFSRFVGPLAGGGARKGAGGELTWATDNRVRLELQTARLRDFSTGGDGVATLVCAPFALHGATVADLAPGHSLVEALRAGGRPQVHVVEWRSATSAMRGLTIDDYLSALNVMVDELEPPVDLIGLCQGGWMTLVYAARFPAKVRRLVIVGAPVDVRAGHSAISRLATDLPLSVFEDIVRLGDGRVPGRHVLELWGPVLAADEADRVLQVAPGIDPARSAALEQRFREWYAWTLDLPGPYYLQVVSWLYKENRIAEGRFVALGRTIDLADVRIPLFLLAARDDELIAVEQLMATARLVGTPKHLIARAIEPCGHVSLFVGARTLAHSWRRIAHWLGEAEERAQAS